MQDADNVLILFCPQISTTVNYHLHHLNLKNGQ